MIREVHRCQRPASTPRLKPAVDIPPQRPSRSLLPLPTYLPLIYKHNSTNCTAPPLTADAFTASAMAGHAAGQRFSISSVTALSKGASAANLFLAQLKKNIKKLEDTWGKFKSTPLDVAYLVRDLSFLSQLILQTIQDSQSTPQISPVLEGALRSCIDKSQELVDLSGKFTARFGRKSLSGSNLKALLSLFTDSKIRFLVTQLLLERYVL